MKLFIKENFDYDSSKPKICAYGNYRDHDFLIIYIGNHPCAYVRCDTNLYKNVYKLVDCPAHGGFTFYNKLTHWNKEFKNINEEILNKYYIGWDYGHFDDYCHMFTKYTELSDDHIIYNKWTTDEIINNVQETIDWMCELSY